jgi:phosphatidylinositol alpha-1,6-mannosyltransferase
MGNRQQNDLSDQIGKCAGDCRMLALVTDAFGGYGGIAQYNRDFLASAASSGLFTHIQSMPRIAPLPTGGLPPSVAQARPLRNRFAYSLRAIIFALRVRPTIIFNAHIYHSPLAYALARITGATLVSQVHGTEVWDGIPRHCRRALERSDLILAVSRDTRSRVLSAVTIAPEKVAVLGNTVGDEFTPGDRIAARRRFGLGDERAILTVARLDDRDGYKGHDRIIRILPEIRRRGNDVIYLIAGLGPDIDRLRRLAADLEVEAQVRFLGMVPLEDLPDLYRAADLFALPSTGEGFGIVFLEAMASGTPAIGLAVGGASDALGDGDLGVCPRPEEFDDALLAMLAARPRRDPSLPVRIRERFGRERFSSALASRLKSLLTEAASPRPSISS